MKIKIIIEIKESEWRQCIVCGQRDCSGMYLNPKFIKDLSDHNRVVSALPYLKKEDIKSVEILDMGDLFTGLGWSGVPVIITPDNIKCKASWKERFCKRWYWPFGLVKWKYKSVLDDGQVMQIWGKVYVNRRTFESLEEKLCLTNQ